MEKKTVCEFFLKLSQVLGDAKDVHDTCMAVTELLVSSLNAKRALIFLKNEYNRFYVASAVGGDNALELLYAQCSSESTAFIEHILKNNETMTIDRVPQELATSSDSHFVVSPLLCRGAERGLLLFESANLDETITSAVEAAAHYSCIGLENRVLYKEGIENRAELAHKVETLQLMYEISKEVVSNLQTEKIVETVAQMVRRIVPCDGATVALLEKDHFDVLTSWGTGIPAGTALQKGDTPFYAALKSGRVLYQHDITSDFASYPRLLQWAQESHVFSYLCVPLRLSSNAFGILVLSSVQPACFTRDDMLSAEKIASQVSIALQNAKLLEDYEEIFLGTVTSLVSAVDAKSKWTKGHSERVAEYAVEFGEKVGLKREALEKLKLAALLHDIGKIGTYESILDKTEKLTAEEVTMIRKHPSQGANILLPLKALREIIPVIKYHHERYDGTGYPDGVAGEDIPLEARILTIVDAYDAIRSDRPYREGLSNEQSIQELRAGAGTQFDPALVSLFLDIVSKEQM